MKKHRIPRLSAKYLKWVATAALLAATMMGILSFAGCRETSLPADTESTSAAEGTSCVESTSDAVTEPQSAPTVQPPRETFVMAPAEDLSHLRATEWENQTFWGQAEYPRNAVQTVSFHAQLEDVPANAWDVSEAKNRSILAWMDGSDLHVAADGNIAPNPNASWLFAGFSNLKDIDFGGCLDTSGVTNMFSMFIGCANLTAPDLSGFDTADVADMSCMFLGCLSLTTLDLSSFHTSNVTSMEAMFSSCRSLTSLDLGDFDTSNVTDMTMMFFMCDRLATLDLGSFDTSNVTSMEAMFIDCVSLTALDLSSFDTSNVASMNSMFGGCSNLISLDLSGFDTANVTNMRGMFGGCSSDLNLVCTDVKIQEEFRNK